MKTLLRSEVGEVASVEVGGLETQKGLHYDGIDQKHRRR